MPIGLRQNRLPLTSGRFAVKKERIEWIPSFRKGTGAPCASADFLTTRLVKMGGRETVIARTTTCNLTSSCYLGIDHSSDQVSPWTDLTNGQPASLEATLGTEELSRRLADLVGCESAVIASSTLHLFWDLFGCLADRDSTILMDSNIYPVARWGIERAAGLGVSVRIFEHHDPLDLQSQVHRVINDGHRPIVVADGFCVPCGCPAPITAYLEAINEFGGQLILDDTQALGILGSSPSESQPYGLGGGGSLRSNSIANSNVIVVSSLAKGFGVPIACMAGSQRLIDWFLTRSETRSACSQPCRPVIHAGEHALWVNQTDGEQLRSLLSNNVRHFQTRLREVGIAIEAGLFPVQAISPIPGVNAQQLNVKLNESGIQTVLIDRHDTEEFGVGCLITANHVPTDLDLVAEAIANAVATLLGGTIDTDSMQPS